MAMPPPSYNHARVRRWQNFFTWEPIVTGNMTTAELETLRPIVERRDMCNLWEMCKTNEDCAWQCNLFGRFLFADLPLEACGVRVIPPGGGSEDADGWLLDDRNRKIVNPRYVAGFSAWYTMTTDQLLMWLSCLRDCEDAEKMHTALAKLVGLFRQHAPVTEEVLPSKAEAAAAGATWRVYRGCSWVGYRAHDVESDLARRKWCHNSHVPHTPLCNGHDHYIGHDMFRRNGPPKCRCTDVGDEVDGHDRAQ
jgi:hypothetical protein